MNLRHIFFVLIFISASFVAFSQGPGAPPPIPGFSPPPIPPAAGVPLDGGAIAILIGGVAIYLRKYFNGNIKK